MRREIAIYYCLHLNQTQACTDNISLSSSGAVWCAAQHVKEIRYLPLETLRRSGSDPALQSH